MKENYVPIRPGILEHLLRGDISACEFGIYAIIHLQADFKTGIWRGSAARIANAAPRGTDLRRVQRALERLVDLGLLKPFRTPGRRGNYPVLINKYTVRSGALKGKRLNAERSSDWRKPIYEACADSDTESDAVGAPYQEVRSKKEEKGKRQAAKPAPPADGRFGEFLEFAKDSFEAKYHRPPTWDCFGKDGTALAAFLRRAPHVTEDVWQSHIVNYFDSTEPFTLKQGGSLSYFVSRFDAFASGPMVAGVQKGGGNGKPTATDLAIQNARSLGLN